MCTLRVYTTVCRTWFNCGDVQEPGHDADLCPLPQSVFPSMPIKKGIGLWQMPTVASNLADANVSWFYSWGPTMLHFAKPADVEFVPMMWSHRDVNIENLQHVTQYKNLLGFNEVLMSTCDRADCLGHYACARTAILLLCSHFLVDSCTRMFHAATFAVASVVKPRSACGTTQYPVCKLLKGGFCCSQTYPVKPI